MFYILYEIRNNLNGKIYVGVHKTDDLNDGYMGSGKVIQSAIKKYGIENFTKRILEQFDNAAAMFAREKEVVTDDFLLREDTYNLRRGGTGGFDYINKTISSTNKIKRASAGGKVGGKVSGRINGSEAVKIKSGIHSGKFYGFKNKENQDKMVKSAWNETAVAKRKETRTKNKFQSGENNSQFGSTWVWHELIGNRKIKKELLPFYIDQGWYKLYIPGFRVN